MMTLSWLFGSIAGTEDDDLPPSHQNRIPRGGHVAGNGRPAVMGSVQYPRMHGDNDMESQIHQLEQEAYSSVLRAFKAQADAISWEKESVITELRKELRLSNEEHRELLLKVNSDDVIRRIRSNILCHDIREWRQSSGLQPGMLNPAQAVHDPLPSPSVSATRKKQKMNPSGPSQSFGAPPPQHLPLPTSSSARRGPVSGTKGKNKKSMMGGASSMKAQHPPPGSAGRGHHGNRVNSGALANEAAETSSFSPLIGRKVKTRWPDDNNFYEATITDFNPIEGRHALVYDMYTPNETWEWVNLEDISPDDLQWVDGPDPGISHKGGYGGPGHGVGRPAGRDSGPGGGRGRGMTKGQIRKDFPPSQNGIGKKGLDDIQLLQTDNVEKGYLDQLIPDPLEIEKQESV
ncbi:EMSY-LIKE 3-like isoform X1 [Tanacetum coccineum]